ncbi:hypothetical protein FRC02_010953 [Tulasnella sp. 418]|nr:hypothetical protein FRC02_010953 [Tulasnella sp. 418]
MGYEQFFHDYNDERTNIENTQSSRLKTLLMQGKPTIPGSPSAWNWKVDEAAERQCCIVLLQDALEGSIYESGAPEHQVPQGPSHMSGTELKEMFYLANTGAPLIWTVKPCLSGFHYWTLQPIDQCPPPPPTSNSSLPSLSNSMLTDSQFSALEVQTPASSVQTSQLNLPCFSLNASAMEHMTPDGNTCMEVVSKAQTKVKGNKDTYSAGVEALIAIRMERNNTLATKRDRSRESERPRKRSQKSMLRPVQETTPSIGAPVNSTPSLPVTNSRPPSRSPVNRRTSTTSIVSSKAGGSTLTTSATDYSQTPRSDLLRRHASQNSVRRELASSRSNSVMKSAGRRLEEKPSRGVSQTRGTHLSHLQRRLHSHLQQSGGSLSVSKSKESRPITLQAQSSNLEVKSPLPSRPTTPIAIQRPKIGPTSSPKALSEKFLVGYPHLNRSSWKQEMHLPTPNITVTSGRKRGSSVSAVQNDVSSTSEYLIIPVPFRQRGYSLGNVDS